MTDLTDHAALVTGASRGIGHAIAGELRRRGASVTIKRASPTSSRPPPRSTR